MGPWNTCWEGRTNDLPNEPIPLMIRPRKYNFDDNDVEVIMNIYHSRCVHVKKSHTISTFDVLKRILMRMTNAQFEMHAVSWSR